MGVATLLECLVVVVVGGGKFLEGGLVECSCFVRSREIRALKHHGHQIYTSKCTIELGFFNAQTVFLAILYISSFEFDDYESNSEHFRATDFFAVAKKLLYRYFATKTPADNPV